MFSEKMVHLQLAMKTVCILMLILGSAATSAIEKCRLTDTVLIGTTTNPSPLLEGVTELSCVEACQQNAGCLGVRWMKSSGDCIGFTKIKDKESSSLANSFLMNCVNEAKADEKCAAGTSVAGEECTPCAKGTFSTDLDSASCEQCPAGETTSDTGSTVKTDCKPDSDTCPQGKKTCAEASISCVETAVGETKPLCEVGCKATEEACVKDSEGCTELCKTKPVEKEDEKKDGGAASMAVSALLMVPVVARFF